MNNIQEIIERFRSEFGLHFDKSELQFAEAFLEEEFEKVLSECKKREEYSVLLAFNIAGYPEDKAKEQTEIIINT